jgi:hypothetical protein
MADNTVDRSDQNCRVASSYSKCSTPGNCHFKDVFDTIEVCTHCNKHK